ncbi:MAG: RsmB/NOP family class I SAM-dependent RNA methyltransferase [Neisseriaceae bacterium]|nr:MAG: RsmB/NOP family class I SAM-dependent RNA methyltransferase [Neisseriaceae bacterium]
MLIVNDNIARACTKLWFLVAEFKQPADGLLSNFFRENRKLGVNDRNAIAETIYAILRNYNKLSKVVNPKNSFTLIGYVWLKILGVNRQQLRDLKTINLGEIDKLGELDLNVIELPQWVIDKLSIRYNSEEIRALAAAMSKSAPLTLRVNTIKKNRDEVMQELVEEGLKAKLTKYSPFGIKLNSRTALMGNKLFADGIIEVQDEASQLAGLLLEPKRGEMIVDFCAGSGGKTLLFGMLMRNSGRIYAFDVNERRLGNLTPRLARSGLSNIFPQLISDEHDTKVKRLIGKIDRVFVDAPCLGLGTLRRNPDLKFRHNQQSLHEINEKQLSILDSAARLVKPSGRLVYATCSILPDENQNIIAQFMALNPDFKIVSLDQVVMLKDLNLGKGDFLELSPAMHDTDGFFACAMQKDIN